MAIFQGFFFLVIGVFLIAIAYQSLAKGWLPFGSNGFKGRLEIRRDEYPSGFWAVFCFYTLVGFGITIYALLVLAGICPPLPLQGGKIA